MDTTAYLQYMHTQNIQVQIYVLINVYAYTVAIGHTHNMDIIGHMSMHPHNKQAYILVGKYPCYGIW